jgi:hypothetical protein
MSLGLDEDQFAAVMKLMEKKTKKPKKERREGEPKRPASSYMMWLKDNRENIILEHFSDVELVGREKVTLVAKKAGALWKLLSDEEKSPWEEKYTTAREEYLANRPEGSGKKSVDFDFSTKDSEETECPDGWNGPHPVKYLWGYTSVGRARGVGNFATLADAITAAEKLGDKCGGITKEKFGYTLRLGGELYQDLNKTYQVSWLKNVYNGKVKSPKRSPSPNRSPSPKSSLESDEEDIVAPIPKISVPKTEPDEESEDDETDDEEISVEPWEYKGTTYLLDESTNIVYDYDNQEEIGRRTKGGKFKKN